MTTIKDMITGVVITCRTRAIALKTAKKRVDYHNSTFSYSHRGMHMPANAYIDEQDDTIYIRGRN